MQNQVPSCAIVELSNARTVAYPLIAWDGDGVALLLTDRSLLMPAPRVDGKILGIHVGDWKIDGSELNVVVSRLLWQHTQERAGLR